MLDLATVLTIIYTKIKVYLYGFIAGGIIQYFEFQLTPGSKFSFSKFIISSCVIGFLTVFSDIFLRAYIDFGGDKNIEQKIFIMSIIGAGFLYLVIPFILSKENRGNFIISVFEKFGFKYIDNNSSYEKKNNR